MSRILSVFLTAWVVTHTRADWPGFLGPFGNNEAEAEGLAKSWPKEGPPVRWTVPVEAGFAAPTVVGNALFFMERLGNEKDAVRSLNLDNGKERWRFEYDAPGNMDFQGARAQPAVDDDSLFTAGPFGHVHRIDRATGKAVWAKKLTDMYSVEQPKWAFAHTPLLYGSTVILAPLGKKVGLVALDKTSGDVVWESPALPEIPGKKGYSSPILVTIDGVDQVVLNTTKGVSGVDARNGALLWYSADWECRIPVASCFPVGEGRIFVSGGYDAGAALFRVERDGQGFRVVTEWKSDECNGQIQPPVLHEGHLYLNANDKRKETGFMCLALDGTVNWNTAKEPGFDWGGTLLAEGMIYVVDGNAGDLCMVRPDLDDYREVGRFHCLDGEKIWGQIVLSDGKLLLRDQSKLVCVDVSAR